MILDENENEREHGRNPTVFIDPSLITVVARRKTLECVRAHAVTRSLAELGSPCDAPPNISLKITRSFREIQSNTHIHDSHLTARMLHQTSDHTVAKTAHESLSQSSPQSILLDLHEIDDATASHLDAMIHSLQSHSTYASSDCLESFGYAPIKRTTLDPSSTTCIHTLTNSTQSFITPVFTNHQLDIAHTYPLSVSSCSQMPDLVDPLAHPQIHQLLLREWSLPWELSPFNLPPERPLPPPLFHRPVEEFQKMDGEDESDAFVRMIEQGYWVDTPEGLRDSLKRMPGRRWARSTDFTQIRNY